MKQTPAPVEEYPADAARQTSYVARLEDGSIVYEGHTFPAPVKRWNSPYALLRAFWLTVAVTIIAAVVGLVAGFAPLVQSAVIVVSGYLTLRVSALAALRKRKGLEAAEAALLEARAEAASNPTGLDSERTRKRAEVQVHVEAELPYIDYDSGEIWTPVQSREWLARQAGEDELVRRIDEASQSRRATVSASLRHTLTERIWRLENDLAALRGEPLPHSAEALESMKKPVTVTPADLARLRAEEKRRGGWSGVWADTDYHDPAHNPDETGDAPPEFEAVYVAEQHEPVIMIPISASRPRTAKDRDAVLRRAMITGVFPPARLKHWRQAWADDPEAVQGQLAAMHRSIVMPSGKDIGEIVGEITDPYERAAVIRRLHAELINDFTAGRVDVDASRVIGGHLVKLHHIAWLEVFGDKREEPDPLTEGARLKMREWRWS